jgi:hypothetical protein
MQSNLEFVSDSLANPGEEVHLRFKLSLGGDPYRESCHFAIAYSSWPMGYTQGMEYLLKAELPTLTESGSI